MSNVEFAPFCESVHEYINKDGDEDYMDMVVFKAVPSNWEKGFKLYSVTFYMEQSLWDLKTRIIRYKCNCKDYINRKRKCKHIRDAEIILNKFKNISYDKIQVQ